MSGWSSAVDAAVVEEEEAAVEERCGRVKGAMTHCL